MRTQSMRIHPTVLLTISDYCAQAAGSPRLCGPLFGEREVAIACSLRSDASMPVSETLDLLRKTTPQLQLIGWFYVGYGLKPDKGNTEDPGHALSVLIEVPGNGTPIIKAFVDCREIELRLESDEPSQIALESAVDFNQILNERRAKLILRDKIRALKEHLKSKNPQDASEALYKYAMLKKVSYLHTNSKRCEDDFMYELLAEVVTTSDNQYKSLHP